MVVPYGGDKATTVPPELAAAFAAGDRLVVVQETGDLLHIPSDVWASATTAVERAHRAFSAMGATNDDVLDAFYRGFARRLADSRTLAPILEANAQDVSQARAKGRSTTRLELTDSMRDDMIESLGIWENMVGVEGPISQVSHDGWRVELRRAGLGVVGFVFEGRPNVFADATGVLRSGNTVVFRIGSDALGTARAIVTHALDPAMEEAGLAEGAVTLVDSPSRAAGWAMFSNPHLALAVARGSGPAVAQLGSVARQAGIPVSLHGTGGAWMVVSDRAETSDVTQAVFHSLDRKVCNTLNTVAVVRDGAELLVPAVLAGLAQAADRRGTNPKLHVVGEVDLPEEWHREVEIHRADGPRPELMTEALGIELLGTEWEWEESPEISLLLVDSIAEAIEAFNAHSPLFAASLLSPDAEEHSRFYESVDAPFVGNGFTRWVDGQYALDRPELGLSNWQFGRLLGRGGVLSGDSVYTIRTVAIQDHSDLGR
ncbi:glutamate-5-semialdehyde dehydrogenase [soil metagenome]